MGDWRDEPDRWAASTERDFEGELNSLASAIKNAEDEGLQRVYDLLVYAQKSGEQQAHKRTGNHSSDPQVGYILDSVMGLVRKTQGARVLWTMGEEQQAAMELAS